jgi:glucan phosphoethanolaminetransferase (alkaline phosphatase superfamily)
MAQLVKTRGFTLSVVSLLPLTACLVAGAPKGTSIALFAAAVCIFHLALQRIGKSGRPIFGGSPGISLRNLTIALFAFLPLLPAQPGDPAKSTQLALLASYISAFYLFLCWLENKSRPAHFAAASLAVFWSAANALYFLMVGDFVGYQVFASVFDTHANESLEFLTSAFFQSYGLRLLVLLAIVWILARLTGTRVVGRAFLPASLIKATALSIWLVTLFHLPRSRSLAIDFYPLREGWQVVRYMKEVHFLVQDYHALSYRFDGRLDTSQISTVILLIGEAARKDKMGIYGSGLDTTPGLEEFARTYPDHLLVFTDAVAASSYTRVSVPSMLSPCPARDFGQIDHRPSILRILKSAGLESVLISNQTKRGFHDNFVSAFMEDATRKTYLTDRGNLFDMELVPPLISELGRSARGSKLIIVHLAGSHFHYGDNYPKDQAFLPPTSIENHYLNSIRYTDTVMKRINEAIMAADHPVLMLYASDHGEYRVSK